MLRQVLEERHVEAVTGFHPLVLVLRLEVIAQEVLREVDVLREVPHPDAPEPRRRLPVHRAARRVDVIDDLRDFLLRAGNQHLVLLRRLVRADRVVDRDAFPGVQAAVVAGIVPREHFRVHRLGVETLHELHRLPRLLRVDRDPIPVLRDVRPAVGPQDRKQRDVGVAAVTHGGAERMADGLAFLPDAEPVLPGVGALLAELLEQIGAHRHRERRLPPRKQLPLSADQVIVRGEPAAVLGGDVARDVVQVRQVVVVEVGVTESGPERGEVVTRARLYLGGLLRLELQVRDDVEPHLHLVLRAPFLELSLQLLVGVGNEARDRQERELAGLRDRGRPTAGQHRAKAGGAGHRHAQELTAAHAADTRNAFGMDCRHGLVLLWAGFT